VKMTSAEVTSMHGQGKYGNHALCGRIAILGENMTRDDSKVTCGNCAKSIAREVR